MYVYVIVNNYFSSQLHVVQGLMEPLVEFILLD